MGGVEQVGRRGASYTPDSDQHWWTRLFRRLPPTVTALAGVAMLASTCSAVTTRVMTFVGAPAAVAALDVRLDSHEAWSQLERQSIADSLAAFRRDLSAMEYGIALQNFLACVRDQRTDPRVADLCAPILKTPPQVPRGAP